MFWDGVLFRGSSLSQTTALINNKKVKERDMCVDPKMGRQAKREETKTHGNKKGQKETERGTRER